MIMNANLVKPEHGGPEGNQVLLDRSTRGSQGSEKCTP